MPWLSYICALTVIYVQVETIDQDALVAAVKFTKSIHGICAMTVLYVPESGLDCLIFAGI